MSLPTDTDGDGVYDPTTFLPGAKPGISAAQLNKMGQGIRDAQLQATAAAAAGLPTTLMLMGG